MSNSTNNGANAGVQANVGMDFQRNCALYLFLEKFQDLEGRKYFIILEHLEDIVFGYLDDTINLAKAETYQAKKSTNPWKLSDLLLVVKKISATCQGILDDGHPKTASFNQENYFITNNTIELKCKVKSVEYKETINEVREQVKYKDLNINIRSKIESGNETIKFSRNDINNLSSFSFRFIDLNRTTRAQYEQLFGKFKIVFGDNIFDHKAALDTLIYAFDSIASTYNQNNVARLDDITKRIESASINEIVTILTTKKKAFELWRNKADSISSSMKISILERNSFKLNFENSFDKFKDLSEAEHQKIFKYVFNNKSTFMNFFTDEDCLEYLVNNFGRVHSTQLTDIQLKASIYAAYIEIKESEI